MLSALLPFCVSARVIDDFNDNTKSNWTDFSFAPPLGYPTEKGGQFVFAMPPAGQAIFSASSKTSESFILKDGRKVEFRVDLVKGNGKDAFAVLAFIPTANSPGTLAGYGFAKSTTDILITKGIGKYFYNENPAEPVKNENITMVLSMMGIGSTVVITAKVLDKDNNDAVLFEKTVIDTPAADVLSDGTDNPASAYLTEGKFVLYLYQDFDKNAPQETYEVVYDNATSFVQDRNVVDDFNDNSKTGWADFSFKPPLGAPKEAGGQFVFNMPSAGQAIFSASAKTSQSFDLIDGERLDFSVDLVKGNGKDSFAILVFAPKGASPGTLTGYGIAKSTTDILITKGLGKYFNNENPTPPIKYENVALGLSLQGVGKSVIITAKVLDKDDNNAVLFEKTFLDTPAADVLSDGKDDPAVPWLGAGNLVLYLYEDFDKGAPQDSYEVVYDNLIALSPPAAANIAPFISDVLPAEYSNFLPASTQISFKVTDDKALVVSKISVTLNGQVFDVNTGLKVTTIGSSMTATLGGLVANQSYVAILKAEDAEGLSISSTLYLDTFDPGSFVVEVEDYNFGGGQFIDRAVPVAEGSAAANSYSAQIGVQGVDLNETRVAPRNSPYRESDSAWQQRSFDLPRLKYRNAGGGDSGVYDYDITEIAKDEFMNYTRTFPAGTYEVYLRESLANVAQAEVLLERVVGPASQEAQKTLVLGSFLGTSSGFQYRNVPLTDGLGKQRVLVNFSGLDTLRLRQMTTQPGDGIIAQNYLVFIPSSGSSLQPATVAGVSPADGAVVETVTPEIRITFQNRDTKVNEGTIRLSVNGAAVTPKITLAANGPEVSYVFDKLPASGASNTARVIFSDDGGLSRTNDWSFVVQYKALDPANRRSGPGKSGGFKVKVVQAPQASGLDNSLGRAEDQLATNSKIPATVTTNVVRSIINFTQNELPSNDGYFEDAETLPGIANNENGTDDIAMEIQSYLLLSAGIHRFGVRCDDGYKITSGVSLSDTTTTPLGFHNGGPADETFDFVVVQTGYYPFRMVWYERGGGAHVEWFSVEPTTGQRTLINDLASGSAIKAFIEIAPEPVAPSRVFSSATVTGPFLEETEAKFDTASRSVTLKVRDNARFYIVERQKRITQIRISGEQVLLGYE